MTDRQRHGGGSASIRPATPDDSPSVVGVIRAVYDEYGLTWDPAHYHADLYDLQGHYLDRGHAFSVAQQPDGAVVATVALEDFDPLPGDPGTAAEIAGTVRLCGCDCSLERLYVHPAARRRGIGQALVKTVLQESRARQRRCLEIWSDKRFLDAHRLYQKLGATPVGERICHDPDQSPEWGLLLRL